MGFSPGVNLTSYTMRFRTLRCPVANMKVNIASRVITAIFSMRSFRAWAYSRLSKYTLLEN